MNVNSNERLYFNLIRRGDLEGLKSAFEKDSDMCNSMPYGQSLILHAVFEKKLDILEFLIKQGCELNKGDDNGLTPLHAAALENDSIAAEILLTAGAQVDIEDKFGSTPLFRAVYSYQDNLSVISLLLKYGASPLKKNKAGVSPYEFAEKREIKSVTKKMAKEILEQEATEKNG